VTDQATPPAQRYADLDFLKGVACLIMLMAHAMRSDIGDPDYATKLILAFQPWGAQLFFFVSGMNVVLLIDRYGARPEFHLTRFYLLSCLALFLLGNVYSLARLSFHTWQIFHGIAACTAATYLLLRRRLSNGSLLVLAAAAYLPYVHFRVAMEPVLQWYRASLPTGAMEGAESVIAMQTIILGLSSAQRRLFTNFSLLPWISYMLLGVAAFRSLRAHPEKVWKWAIGFAAFFAAGIAALFWSGGIQPMFWHVDTATDALLRHPPHLAFTAAGAAGIAWLLARWAFSRPTGPLPAWRRKLVGAIGRLGQWSLIFFVWHWVALNAMEATWGWMVKEGWVSAQMPIHLRWPVAFALALPTTALVARLGEWWARVRWAGWQMLIALLAALAGTGWLHAERQHFWGVMTSLLACLFAAYLYPVFREVLKRRYSRPRVRGRVRLFRRAAEPAGESA
jgi:uncharacterized membrane protein